MSRPAAITSALVGLGAIAFTTAIALPFDDRVEFRSGNQIDSKPAWLVPQKAEFLGIQRGYGGLKILAAIAGTTAMGGVMVISRSAAAREPVRQRIRGYQNQVEEFSAAAESAYQMALTQQRYKTLLEADQVAFEGQIETAYLESMGVDPTSTQPALPGNTLDQVTNPGDKVREAEAKTAIRADAQADAIASDPAPIEPTKTPLDRSSETSGMAVIDGLVGSRRSLLLVGATGAGKSVTEACLLTKFLERYPDAEVWAIAQKNDSFCGLDKKGRVVLFDSLEPKSALKTIDHIHGIYNQRRRLPEHARIELPPVRLVLADWLSVNQALEESSKDESIKSSKYLTKLTDIIYNGRELNVCLWVDLQSFNLTAIGLKADANSRKNFNLVGLGNYSVDEFGSINESYGVLANMVGNKYMVADEDERTALLAEFKRLKPVSKQHQRPIIFTTLEPARVALLPDLRRYKPGHQVKLEGYSSEYLERIYRLEFDLNKDTRVPDSPTDRPNLSDGQTGSSDKAPGCPIDSGQPEPLSEAVSGFTWSVRKVRELYPDTTPEQLFLSVSASAQTPNVTARDIIKSILKCREGNDHPTRSYTRHGKTLLRWLIENYDDGAIASLPEIKKFLEAQP